MSDISISSTQPTDLQAAETEASISAEFLAQKCTQELFLFTAAGAAVTQCLLLDPSSGRKSLLCAQAFACVLAHPATLLQHLKTHADDLAVLNQARRHAETKTKAAGL